jgi:uncharacterized membrane protein (UPF0127 family)
VLSALTGVGGMAALTGCAGDAATGDGTDSPAAASGGTPAGRSGDAGTTVTPVPTASADATGTPGTPRTPGAGTATPTALHPGYETTTVVARTQAGEVLGSVTAAIADTRELRYRGLSDTEALPADRGMLFVFAESGEYTFVMRGMTFGIDIVFADPDGTITRIHHAPAPGPDEDGAEQRYPGTGQYVLEVNRGWTTDHDVDRGDVLDFER